jgi:uncharacterized protein (TIGR00255 family)
MQSMTGFGRATASGSGYTVQAELSSLNNRYLELSLKLPRTLMYYQHPMRELLRSRLGRGKVTVYIGVSRTEDAPIQVELDMALARAYHQASQRISSELGVNSPIGVRDLMNMDGVLSSGDSSGENEALWAIGSEALELALKAFIESRVKEGAVIEQDFNTRLDLICEIFTQLVSNWEERRGEVRRNLEEKLGRLIEGTELKPERFEMEVAVLLDKQDISEEITRFRSHVDLFRDTMRKKGPVGSKLGFVLQEMVREANTISSKSPDVAITHMVVQIKEEVERIREQVQNVE